MVDIGTIFFKGSTLCLLFNFLFSNYGAYYYSESKPIVYPNAVHCKFLGVETSPYYYEQIW